MVHDRDARPVLVLLLCDLEQGNHGRLLVLRRVLCDDLLGNLLVLRVQLEGDVGVVVGRVSVLLHAWRARTAVSLRRDERSHRARLCDEEEKRGRTTISASDPARAVDENWRACRLNKRAACFIAAGGRLGEEQRASGMRNRLARVGRRRLQLARAVAARECFVCASDCYRSLQNRPADSRGRPVSLAPPRPAPLLDSLQSSSRPLTGSSMSESLVEAAHNSPTSGKRTLVDLPSEVLSLVCAEARRQDERWIQSSSEWDWGKWSGCRTQLTGADAKLPQATSISAAVPVGRLTFPRRRAVASCMNPASGLDARSSRSRSFAGGYEQRLDPSCAR